MILIIVIIIMMVITVITDSNKPVSFFFGLFSFFVFVCLFVFSSQRRWADLTKRRFYFVAVLTPTVQYTYFQSICRWILSHFFIAVQQSMFVLFSFLFFFKQNENKQKKKQNL